MCNKFLYIQAFVFIICKLAITAAAKSTNNGTVLGTLNCFGKKINSEVIYWKIVPGDAEYESPITPHHDHHDKRFITFEVR
jgi:hypothetical protein